MRHHITASETSRETAKRVGCAAVIFPAEESQVIRRDFENCLLAGKDILK